MLMSYRKGSDCQSSKHGGRPFSIVSTPTHPQPASSLGPPGPPAHQHAGSPPPSLPPAPGRSPPCRPRPRAPPPRPSCPPASAPRFAPAFGGDALVSRHRAKREDPGLTFGSVLGARIVLGVWLCWGVHVSGCFLFSRCRQGIRVVGVVRATPFLWKTPAAFQFAQTSAPCPAHGCGRGRCRQEPFGRGTA